MRLKILLCCASVALLGPAVHAAGPNCTKVRRPVERLICADAKLRAADGQMVSEYQADLRTLPAVLVGLLRADQVQWLAWVEETCDVPIAGSTARKSRTGVVAGTGACMLPLYTARTKELHGLILERDGVRFLMRTQYLALSDEQAQEHPDWPAFGTLRATWPMAISAAVEWVAWNRAAEAAAYALTAEDTSSSGKVAAKTPAWTESLAEGADTEVSVRVRRVEHSRVTSASSLNTMGHGAAHPSETFTTLTWLLQPGRPLRVEDVFAPGEAWKKTVAEACWKAIQASDKREYVYSEVTGPDAKQLQAVVADTGNWTLEHDGLHISYPEYAVTPHIASLDDTVIPWAALQPVLAAGFIAP